jgi:hypothetical protein
MFFVDTLRRYDWSFGFSDSSVSKESTPHYILQYLRDTKHWPRDTLCPLCESLHRYQPAKSINQNKSGHGPAEHVPNPTGSSESRPTSDAGTACQRIPCGPIAAANSPANFSACLPATSHFDLLPRAGGA